MAQAIPRERVVVHAWIAVVVLLTGYRFFHFISQQAVNILFWDQWDFLTSFFGGHPTLKTLFFWQHGPHREGLGLIADRFLYAATNWNIRAESFFIGGCIFAAMLAALALVRNLFGSWSWTDAAIPLIFLTLVQWETMVGTPNPAYGSIPLLLIVLYSLALLQPNWLLRYTLVLLLDFPLIYTGFGLFMGMVTMGVFALECYWRLRRSTNVPAAAPAAGFLLACAAQASFFLIHYTFQPAADCFTFPHAPFKPYLVFFNVMFANYAGIWIPQDYGWMPPAQMMSLAGTAPAVILGAVFLVQAWRLLKPNPDRRAALVIAVLLTYSGIFALNTAVGRLCLGPGGAFTSRYATLLIPAFLGLYLFARGIGAPALRGLAMLLLAVLVIPGSVITPNAYRYYTSGKRAWAECYLEKGDIAACDAATHFQIHPYPVATKLQQKLDYLKKNHLSLFAGR